jgi:sugar/nucleoside kinase (ribokinase family)
MIDHALTPFADGGRDARGRFVKGCPGGPGNPHGGQVSRLRARLLSAVSEDDIAEVVTALLERAKSGDIAAARFVAEYTIGRSSAMPGHADGPLRVHLQHLAQDLTWIDTA